MMPKDGQFFCRKCQAFHAASGQSQIVSASKQEMKEAVILEEVRDTRPRTTDVECPKCGTRDAWWFLLQTRKADEAETTFLECTKCRTWGTRRRWCAAACPGPPRG